MDKKIYARVSLNVPATVITDDGTELPVTAIDTTRESVTILCTLNQREAIAPGGNCVLGGRPVQVSLLLNLPDGTGRDAVVQAKCHLASARRLSKAQCMVGMRYVDIESRSLNRLESYLQQASGRDPAKADRSTPKAPA